jgi:hypothetical protein
MLLYQIPPLEAYLWCTMHPLPPPPPSLALLYCCDVIKYENKTDLPDSVGNLSPSRVQKKKTKKT